MAVESILFHRPSTARMAIKVVVWLEEERERRRSEELRDLRDESEEELDARVRPNSSRRERRREVEVGGSVDESWSWLSRGPWSFCNLVVDQNSVPNRYSTRQWNEND